MQQQGTDPLSPSVQGWAVGTDWGCFNLFELCPAPSLPCFSLKAPSGVRPGWTSTRQQVHCVPVSVPVSIPYKGTWKFGVKTHMGWAKHSLNWWLKQEEWGKGVPACGIHALISPGKEGSCSLPNPGEGPCAPQWDLPFGAISLFFPSFQCLSLLSLCYPPAFKV